MEKREQLNKAEQKGKVMSVFMISGFAALSGGLLLSYKVPKLIPVVVCLTGVYLVVSAVLAVRAIREIRNVK